MKIHPITVSKWSPTTCRWPRRQLSLAQTLRAAWAPSHALPEKPGRSTDDHLFVVQHAQGAHATSNLCSSSSRIRFFGMMALLIGPIQCSPRFRERHLKIHRVPGRIYVWQVRQHSSRMKAALRNPVSAKARSFFPSLLSFPLMEDSVVNVRPKLLK